MENIKSFEEFINEGNDRDWQQASNYKVGNDNAKQYLKERLDEIDNAISNVITSGASELNNWDKIKKMLEKMQNLNEDIRKIMPAG